MNLKTKLGLGVLAFFALVAVVAFEAIRSSRITS